MDELDTDEYNDGGQRMVVPACVEQLAALLTDANVGLDELTDDWVKATVESNCQFCFSL